MVLGVFGERSDLERVGSLRQLKNAGKPNELPRSSSEVQLYPRLANMRKKQRSFHEAKVKHKLSPVATEVEVVTPDGMHTMKFHVDGLAGRVHECVTTALQPMHDHLQQTTVIAQRRSQKMLSEQHASKTKGHFAYEALEAFSQARDRQEEATRLYEHNCEEAAEPETKFNGSVKDTLEKAEALEKHVKKVSTKAEFTEADFFKTLIDRHEEAQTQHS